MTANSHSPDLFLTPSEAASQLRAKKSQILKTWEYHVCNLIECARKQTHPVLLDHIPVFLDNLAEAIEHCETKENLKPVAYENARIGKEHGEQRAQLGEYSFDQIIAEYRALRSILLKALESDKVLALSIQLVLHSFIDEAISKATTEFLRIHQNNVTAMYEHNIAEQRRGEEKLKREHDALKEERTWLHAIFTHCPAALSVTRGSDLVFEMANPAYRKMIGPNRPIEGKSLEEAFPDMEASFMALHKKVFETGERAVLADFPVTLDWEYNGHPSQKFFTNVFEPLKDDSGKVYGMVTFGYEVTDQVLYRRKMKADKDMLELEKDLREQFVATLSHDLRSPLTAAKMSAQVILRRPAEADFVKNQASRVVKNVNRADQMIQDLLDVNQIRAGEKMQLEMQDTNLSDVITTSISDLSSVHGDLFHLDVEPGITGNWNANALHRVIDNLVNNAIKYGEDEKPVKVTLKKVEGQAVLSVHNEGNPIPADDQETIFEPYRRTGSAKRSGQKGWGLGLTLVRGTAEAHQGTVTVSSAPKVGTTFTMILPIVDPLVKAD